MLVSRSRPQLRGLKGLDLRLGGSEGSLEAVLSQLLLGFILSLGVASAAWRLGVLTSDGAATGVAVGSLIFGFGGWRWAAVLVVFFVTGSLLTRWQASRKPQPEHTRGRSADQVLASGAVATALAIWYGIAPAPWMVAAVVGTIAASTADTWATEIGLLSVSQPRLITTGQVVVPGRSGGVTWIGTLGGVAGAALIAAAGAQWLQTSPAVVWIAGSLAMVLDSVLGATLEGRVRWVDNNAVNLLATFSGAVLAFLLSR